MIHKTCSLFRYLSGITNSYDTKRFLFLNFIEVFVRICDVMESHGFLC